MRSASRGFTLVELLVAVTMLGVLMVLLFSAMRTGTRSWQAAEEHIAASEGIVQAERFLARLVGAALPLGGGGGSGTASAARRSVSSAGVFEGSANRLVLVAPGVRALPRPGLYRYEVFSEARSDTSGVVDLWVSVQPYRPGDDASGEPRLLQEGVVEFAVRYYGVADAREEPQWVDEWPADLGALPTLVEIRLRLADGPERPLIIAAPVVAEDV